MTAPYTTETDEERRRRQELEQGAADGDLAPDSFAAAPPSTASPTAAAPTPPAPPQPSFTASQSGSVPSGFVPPPPPPPPPPPDLGDLSAQVRGFASDWMKESNPYLGDLATATRKEGEARFNEAEEAARRDIEEWAQSRGLLGSSYEGEQRVRLAGEMGRARNEQERALLEQLAMSEASGREGAGEFGLRTVSAQDVAGLERYRAQLEAEQLREAQRQFGGTLEISQQQIDLRAQEIQNQARLTDRSLDIEEARDQARTQLEREQMAQQESQFGRTLGVSQQEIDLRAQQLQQEAALQGRTLDLQEARDQANVALQREQMEFQLTLQGNEIAQREAEFARQYGLSEREFVASQEQFAQTYAEQVAGRLQQDEQFRTTLASEDARFAVESGLRTRALDLQQQGMEADDAYRQAALEQERALTESAQALQARGMDMEDAYRYAALEQDAFFRGEANRLTELGMSQEDAYRYAELAFRDRALETEDERERARLDFEIWLAETEGREVRGDYAGGGGGRTTGQTQQSANPQEGQHRVNSRGIPEVYVNGRWVYDQEAEARSAAKQQAVAGGAQPPTPFSGSNSTSAASQVVAGGPQAVTAAPATAGTPTLSAQPVSYGATDLGGLGELTPEEQQAFQEWLMNRRQTAPTTAY